MEIDLTLTSEEWHRFQKYVQRKKMKEQKGVLEGLGPNLILWGGATFVFVIMFDFTDRPEPWIGMTAIDPKRVSESGRI